MGIIHDAQAFVQSLLAPLKRRRCPRCGSPLLKKNGTYTRTLRDLGGIRQIRVQRCRCCDCGHTFSEQRPEIAPHRWYTRRVQRKYLDHFRKLKLASDTYPAGPSERQLVPVVGRRSATLSGSGRVVATGGSAGKL